MTSRSLLVKSLFALITKGGAAIAALVFNFIVVTFYANEIAAKALVIVTAVLILSIVVRLGSDQFLVRIVAKRGVTNNVNHKLIGALNSTFLLLWLALTLLLILLNAVLGFLTFYHLCLFSFSLIFFSLTQVNSFILQGQNRVFLHVFYLNLCLYVVLIFLHFLIDYSNVGFGLSRFLELYAISTLLCFVSSSLFTKLRFSRFSFSNRYKTLILTNLPYCLFAFVQICLVWSPQIWLFVSSYSQDVPSYTLMHRFSLVLGFVLISISAVFTPRFARALHQKDTQKIVSECGLFIKLAVSAALVGAVVLWLSVEDILSMVSKSELYNGIALLILFSAQLINCVTGPALKLLQMAGKLTNARKVQSAMFIFHILFGYWVVNAFGVVGASLVAAFSIVLCNLFYGVLVLSDLKINIYSHLFKFK